MKKRYVVAYDISSDKRRNRVSKFLLGYGVRVQYSVFECELDRYELMELMEALESMIDEDEDRVYIYQIYPEETMRIGVKGFYEEDILIF